MKQLIRFVPFGFAATLIGLYATYRFNETRCPDLTLSFLWDLVPVSAYVFMFPASLVIFSQSLESLGESLNSFYGMIMWGAIAHGLFLLPLVFLTFPAERFFGLGANCKDYGGNYFASVISPFAIAQSSIWIVSLFISAWFESARLKKP